MEYTQGHLKEDPHSRLTPFYVPQQVSEQYNKGKCIRIARANKFMINFVLLLLFPTVLVHFAAVNFSHTEE